MKYFSVLKKAIITSFNYTLNTIFPFCLIAITTFIVCAGITALLTRNEIICNKGELVVEQIRLDDGIYSHRLRCLENRDLLIMKTPHQTMYEVGDTVWLTPQFTFIVYKKSNLPQ